MSAGRQENNEKQPLLSKVVKKGTQVLSYAPKKVASFKKQAFYYEQYSAEKLEKFKYADGSEVNIPYQRIFGLFDDGRDHYTRERIEFKSSNTLDIIVRENIANDTILIWRTTGAKIKEALRMGVLRPEALTSLAIAEVGKYRLKRASHMLYSGIVSVLDEEKLAIVDRFQDRVALFQPLERCLNEPFDVNKPSDMVTKINACLQQIEENKGAEVKVINQLREELNRNGTTTNMGKSSKWLKTKGFELISAFITSEIIHALAAAQADNQTLAYKKAWLRGDLNNHIEDTIKLVREYRQDFHTHVTKEHQLVFDEKAIVLVDSQHHIHSSDDLTKFLMGVSVIECPDQINPKNFIKTSGTKFQKASWPWGVAVSYDTRSRWVQFKDLCKAAGWGILNIPEVMLFGAQAKYFDGLMPKLTDSLNPHYKDEITFFAILQRLKVNQVRVSTKIGMLLHKTGANLLWEGLAKGLYDLGGRVIDGFVSLHVDWKQGHPPKDRSLDQVYQDILDRLKKEIVRVSEENTAAKEWVDNRLVKEDNVAALPSGSIFQIADVHSSSLDEKQYYAHPRVSLTPYRSHGLVNTMVDGVVYFINYFEHNMMSKHPFISAFSLAVCSQSFLAFFDTDFTFGGPGYKAFLKSMGEIWAKDRVSASVASAFTYYKLIAAGLELGMHGFDSWLVTAAQKFWNDPAAILVFSFLSWFAGHSVITGTWGLYIPYVTEKLKEHVGSAQGLAELFGGFKLIGAFYHLLLASEHDRGHKGQNREKELRAECVKLFTLKFEEKHKKMPNADQVNQFNAEFDRLTRIDAPENISSYGSAEETPRSSATPAVATAANPIQSLAVPEVVLDVKAMDDQKISVESVTQQDKVDKIRFAIIFSFATNIEKLTDIDAGLKRELRSLLPSLMPTQEGVLAMQKALFPEDYAHRAPLRQFVGRVGAYLGTGVRCCCSVVTRSSQPWEVGLELLEDDVASTADGVLRLGGKLAEFICNRFPRMISDVLCNSGFARAETRLLGSSKVTDCNYSVSDDFNQCQLDLYSATTGKLINKLSHSATPADPAESIRAALKPQLELAFGKLFKAAKASQTATAAASSPHQSPRMSRD